jgi:hypothetical protein
MLRFFDWALPAPEDVSGKFSLAAEELFFFLEEDCWCKSDVSVAAVAATAVVVAADVAADFTAGIAATELAGLGPFRATSGLAMTSLEGRATATFPAAAALAADEA